MYNQSMQWIQKNKRPIIITIVLLSLALAIYYWKRPIGLRTVIGSKEFLTEVVMTPQAIQKGLGERVSLPENKAMLFLFSSKQQYSFWMKNMNFPIDIIWIDDNKIVDISKNVPVIAPGQPLPTYTPIKPVNRVLEINAGLSNRYNFNIGDTVRFTNK